QSLLKKVEGHLFEVSGRTLQTTLSIGVAGVNEQTAKAQEVVDRAHRCADELPGNGLKIYDPADDLRKAASQGNVVAM
ncbi:ferrous iron transporter C, partial [Citrobacter sp. AAK_AS5]